MRCEPQGIPPETNKGAELINTTEKKLWVKYRHLGFALFIALLCIVFYGSLRGLIVLLWSNEIYSHIMVVPFVSAYVFYLGRREILSRAEYSFAAGAAIAIAGILITLATKGLTLSQNDLFSIKMLSALVVFTGGVVFFYGFRVYRAALFSMLFLFLMIPLPDAVVNGYTSFLQQGSTEVVNGLFAVLRMPAIRQSEYVYSLPGLTFEVAPQCSGIRSGIALFLISIFVGKLFLRGKWSRTILVLSVVPITILKNGLRIFAIVTLSAYWDPRIMEGDLHRSGGTPFLFLALAFMAPVFLLLRGSESKKTKS
jgi:exosortase